MDLTKIPIMAAMKQRMHWLSAKQKLTAENIANANTPGYTPMKLKAQDFAALVAATDAGASTPATSLKRTESRHFDINGGVGNGAPQEERRKEVFERVPSGNGVVLEEQLIDQANTQLEYNTLLNLYRKHTGMLRTALGRGGQG